MTHTPAPAHSAVVRVLTRAACMAALVATATTYALLTAPAHTAPHTAHSDVCTAHSTQAECLPGLTPPTPAGPATHVVTHSVPLRYGNGVQ